MINVVDVKEKVLEGYEITKEEAGELLQVPNKEEFYKQADIIRQFFCGDKMDLCSIVNARSGRCSEDCKWCSQSAFHVTNIQTYELVNKQEAIRLAIENESQGVGRFSLVTSGKTISNRQLKNLVSVFEGIRKESSIGLCASMGLLNKQQLLELKDVGIEKYHCNLETAPSFFKELCSTHTMDEKIETIKFAQEIGLDVCSGGIIGMGETMKQRVELAFQLKELGVRSIPINILDPIKGTKLENQPPLTEEEVLTTIAIFRFVNPKAYLRFAGGRLRIKHFQHKALRAGINAALVGNYLTTVGSSTEEDLRDFKAAGFSV